MSLKYFFFFLKIQIAHLDIGEPLDNPDVQFSNVSREKACHSRRRFDYKNWNATASKHHNRGWYAQNAAAHGDPFESDVNKPNPAEGRR